MKKLFLMLSLMLVLVGCGDSNKERVTTFAGDFARYINSGMVDSVAVYYPEVRFAEGLTSLSDNVEIQKGDAPDTYIVTFNGSENITVSTPKDGEIKVISSTGLFKYPEEKLTFAHKVGALKPELTDLELATKIQNIDSMSVALYDTYVAQRKEAVKFVKYVVTHDVAFSADEGTAYIELKNTTDKPISANDYEITLRCTEYGLGTIDNYDKKGETIDIPAGGTVKIPVNFYERLDVKFKSVDVKTPDRETFFKEFEPQGNEYDTYIKEHGELPAKAITLN